MPDPSENSENESQLKPIELSLLSRSGDSWFLMARCFLTQPPRFSPPTRRFAGTRQWPSRSRNFCKAAKFSSHCSECGSQLKPRELSRSSRSGASSSFFDLCLHTQVPRSPFSSRFRTTRQCPSRLWNFCKAAKFSEVAPIVRPLAG